MKARGEARPQAERNPWLVRLFDPSPEGAEENGAFIAALQAAVI